MPLDSRWATHLRCTRSGDTAPLDEPAFVSPVGAPWRVEYRLDPSEGPGWRQALPHRPWTLWRYRELLPVEQLERRVDLGEGGTPLVTSPPSLLGAEVALLVKDESGNPAGSFKARGLAVAISRARELGAPGVELASAGNAAVALAAYAAAAGIPARVALPGDTPARIEELCRLHGAEVRRGGATLVESRARLAAVPRGYWDLSTFREPYRVEGKKTMGLELAEQLGWRLPDWIVYPTGGGTGIVGMAKAFDELQALGLVNERRPRLVVVQMEGCAPLVRALQEGRERATPWEEPRTRVWGLRVPVSLADDGILAAVRASQGTGVAVAEARVEELIRRAGRAGVAVGPEGAAALAGTEALIREGAIRPGEQVVVFQTGRPDNYR